MRWLIELMTVFDWITPVVETGKDVAHYTTGDDTNYFTISARDERSFRQLCREHGVKVVSVAGGPFRENKIMTVGNLSRSDVEILSSVAKDFAAAPTRR